MPPSISFIRCSRIAAILAYSPTQLLNLGPQVIGQHLLPASITECTQSLGIHRRARGCRAGRNLWRSFGTYLSSSRDIQEAADCYTWKQQQQSSMLGNKVGIPHQPVQLESRPIQVRITDRSIHIQPQMKLNKCDHRQQRPSTLVAIDPCRYSFPTIINTNFKGANLGWKQHPTIINNRPLAPSQIGRNTNKGKNPMSNVSNDALHNKNNNNGDNVYKIETISVPRCNRSFYQKHQGQHLSNLINNKCRNDGIEQTDGSKRHIKNHPSLFVMNVAAITKPHTTEQLHAELASLNVDMAIISETHLKSKHKDATFDLNGYSLFR